MANLSNINGKFVVEQTTGYVGVGTTDPNYPIEVLNASAEIALNASGGSIYRVQSDSASNFIIRKEGVGDRLVINSAGNSTFAGTVTAAQYYKSSTAYNVIGTASSGEVILRPTAWNLSTAQSSFSTTLATIGTDATFAGNIFLPTASSYIKFGGYSYIGEDLTEQDSLTIASDSTESIYFAHYNQGTSTYTTTVQIDPSGNVMLDVNNWLQGHVTVGGGTQNLIRSRAMGYPGYYGCQIGQETNHIALFIDPNSVVGGAFSGNVNELMLPNKVIFQQANAVANPTDWLNGQSITLDNGKVGIGTTSPDYTLDVEKDVDTWIARIYNTGNDANAQGLLIRSDANSSHDALVMGVYADGGYKMILRSTGLLGIGVSPFVNNLTNGVGIDLKNNAGLIGYANAMYISSNAYYNSGWKYKAAGTANLLQVGSTTGTVSLRQAISGSINQAISFDQTITILNNGNVGIGYTNPASNKLEVNGRAYIGPIGTGFGTTKPTMQSNAVLRLKPHDTNSTNMNFASVNGGGGIGIQTTNGPGTANWDIALSPFGGDVGIGMVQPAAKLDVVGNIATGTRDGGVGYKNQLFQCSKTATGSGVGIDVMFVGHTHALNITVMCIIDGAQAAVGRGYALSTYGYATATLTQTKVNGNMVGVSMIYVNSGGSESYILRVTPTYAGSSNPTIYLSAQGQSNILLRTAV